jgi:hypothetical protein
MTMKLMIVMGMIALAALWFAIATACSLRRLQARFDAWPLIVLARRIARDASPQLWKWVEQTAAKCGSQIPDHIVVGLAEGFFVTSCSIALRPTDETLNGRTLHFPILSMALLDHHENTAILAHELAHFAGMDTQFSEQFLPIYSGLERHLEDSESRGDHQFQDFFFLRPSLTFGRFFHQEFDHAVSRFRREREFAADAVAAKATDARTCAAALLRYIIGGDRIDETVKQILGPTHTGEDAVGVLRAIIATSGIGNARQHLRGRVPHPSDTHPPLAERLTALNQTAPELLMVAARPPCDDFFERLTAYFPNAKDLSASLTKDLIDDYRGGVKARLEARREAYKK